MIVKIQNEILSVSIDTLGAQMVSMADSFGTDYLWQGDAKYWSGRAPILFPFIGKLRNGKTMISGEEYAMKPHGFARNNEFSLIHMDRDSAVFSLRSNHDIQKLYPFDFELKVTYTLEFHQLVVGFDVENMGEDTMYFSIGGHPAFNVPLYEGENFEDYVLEFEQTENAACPFLQPDGLIDMDNRRPVLQNTSILPLNHRLFDKDALIFDNLNSKTVKLCHRTKKHGIAVAYHAFPYLGVWSAANDAPFVCIEPWTGISTCTDESGEFSKRRGITSLGGHEYFETAFMISLL